MNKIDFQNKYTTQKILETYGNDLDQVLDIAKNHPMKLWTMIVEDDKMYLTQGYHFVNRAYYLITNENAQSNDEEYLFDDDNDEEE